MAEHPSAHSLPFLPKAQSSSLRSELHKHRNDGRRTPHRPSGHLCPPDSNSYALRATVRPLRAGTLSASWQPSLAGPFASTPSKCVEHSFGRQHARAPTPPRRRVRSQASTKTILCRLYRSISYIRQLLLCHAHPRIDQTTSVISGSSFTSGQGPVEDRHGESL